VPFILSRLPMFPNGALKGLTLAYAGVDERMLSWR
jgi:hypothetical protein